MPYHNSSYRTLCDTSDNVCLRDQKAVTSCLMHTCSMTLSVYVSSHERVVCLICAMVLNATFNNISVISWRSVLLVEETGVPGHNHPPAADKRYRLASVLCKYEETCLS